jgi:hypothetical protein
MPADPREQPTGENKARSTVIGFMVLRLAASFLSLLFCQQFQNHFTRGVVLRFREAFPQ